MPLHSLTELARAWEVLSETPVDADGYLDTELTLLGVTWPVGTDHFEIWEWFEDAHPDFYVTNAINGLYQHLLNN
jgi:hypothetical protein